MIAAFGLALLAQAGSLSGCAPGAKIEGRLGGEWLPATVVEARPDECVVKMMYVGVEQTVHLAPKDFRAEPSVPALAQRAAARNLDSSPQSGSIVSTTPEQIYDDFARDGAAAAAKYVGSQLRIIGAAHDIADGQITFFRLGYDLVATCDFPATARPKLAQLQKGQRVTVTGYVESRVSQHTLKVSSCVLEKAGGLPQAASVVQQPPAGRYLCHSGGEQNGFMDLTPSSYVVDGVRGDTATIL